MKNIILPTNDPTTICVDSIASSIEGVIICYLKDEPVGFIVYETDDECWHYKTQIDTWYDEDSNSSLNALITSLIVLANCDSFKLIEFNYDK